MSGGGGRGQHRVCDARYERVGAARVAQQLALQRRQQHLRALGRAQQLDVALQVQHQHIHGLAEGLQRRGWGGVGRGYQRAPNEWYMKQHTMEAHQGEE
jgi:hypothetical protein